MVELIEERRKGHMTERVMVATASSHVISATALAAVAPDPGHRLSFAFGTANGPAADPSIAGVHELGPPWREVGEHRTLGGFYPVLPGGR
jgi:hypothetical protein